MSTRTIPSSSSIHIPKIFDQFNTLYDQALSSVSSLMDSGSPGSSSARKRTFKFSRTQFKNKLPLFILIIGALVMVLVISAAIRSVKSASPTSNQLQLAGPTKSMVINKELLIPVNDSKGKELTKLKFTVESAELRDELIVKGKRAVAIEGRTFLILNVKVVNEFDKPIDINTRDFVRITVNGNDTELLAADIHNDPVKVQAISTKPTRLGFPINDTDANLVLHLGEIKKEKETVALDLK